MKECPGCGRFYDDTPSFCPIDGTKLVESVQNTGELADAKARRLIPPPPQPLRIRLTIVDQGDEGHRSRVIQGLVHDVGQQGMRIQTGTVETGQLNIIRDYTTAFKNKIEAEVDLPNATVKYTGFAAWYKPSEDGINWMVGVYIRDMPAADRRAYDQYLEGLMSQNASDGAPAQSQAS